MTRINAGIPPRLLSNKHLLAEHREIKRIPNNVLKHGYVLHTLPNSFTLGTGHIKFFYNKMRYLFNRYELLYKECKQRGFDVQYYGGAFEPFIDSVHWNDWVPHSSVTLIVAARINERLGLKSKQIHVIDWHITIDKPVPKLWND